MPAPFAGKQHMIYLSFPRHHPLFLRVKRSLGNLGKEVKVRIITSLPVRLPVNLLRASVPEIDQASVPVKEMRDVRVVIGARDNAVARETASHKAVLIPISVGVTRVRPMKGGKSNVPRRAGRRAIVLMSVATKRTMTATTIPAS
jgi:hypothetical protein